MRYSWLRRFIVSVVIGLTAVTGAVSVRAATYYYVATNSAANGPGTAWTNAFHTIQGAVNVAVGGDTVLVTNGVYNSGGAVTPGYSLTNRACITSAITLRSVNGPSNTFIVGAVDPVSTNGPAAVRCVYLVFGAVVSGFTLTNGNSMASGSVIYDQSAGGALLHSGGTVSNCLLTGCSAYYTGGGAVCLSGGTLNNCTISGNSLANGGYFAGAGVCCYNAGGTVNNCTISGNNSHAASGGGVCCSALAAGR